MLMQIRNLDCGMMDMYYESKYEYNVYLDNSPGVFKNTCKKISSFLQGLIAEPLLVDVDGTTIQVFKKESKEIVVYDDYDLGVVFVKSDINLDKLLLDK